MASRIALQIVLALACLAASRALRTLHQAETKSDVKICVPKLENKTVAEACTEAVSAANTANLAFSCVMGGSVEGCSTLVKAGSATLTRMGATEMYTAHQEYGFVPLVSENYGDLEGTSYYSVAVAPASMCTGKGMSLASLQGKRSCHTGYGRTAGWTMPVGYLAESGAMPVVGNQSGVQVDAQSVASFFSETCAPGTNTDGPLDGGKAWDKLCTACKGDCSTSDPYADYSGTLRCVMEGAGDVAFTKHSIPLEYAADGTTPADWSTMAKSDLRLLCPSGGCAPVDDYASCNLAKVPAGALVGPAELQGSALGRSIQAALTAAANNSADFVAAAKTHVFSESTEGIKAQTKSFNDYFGSETRNALAGSKNLKSVTPTASQAQADSPTEVKLCIPDDASSSYVAACTNAMAAANTATVKFSCMAGGSQNGCSEMVKSGTAQLTKLGATEQYTAHEEYGLVPLVTEYYGADDGASYYSVAVVPASMCSGEDVSLASLQGKRSCHTGYGRTAGWTMPVGYLAESGAMPVLDGQSGVQVDAQSVASFFSETCAPGANTDGPLDGGKAWDKLCTACKGDCSTSDPYADYSGTLRCVMEGAGDVAFTKHNIPLEYAADGTTPAVWSTMAKSDLRLLCPSGGCAPVDDYNSCNLAKVPAGALVGPAELQGSPLGNAIKSALVSAAQKDGTFLASTKELMGNSRFVFSDSTVGLQAQNASFEDFFTTTTIKAIEGVDTLKSASSNARTGGSGSSSPQPTPHSSGVSSGAAAGIGIGCAVAGALIAAVATWLIMKRKAAYRPHMDEGTKVIPPSMNLSDHSAKMYA